MLVDNTPSDDAIQDSSDDAGDFELETEQPEATMPGLSFVVDNQQRPIEQPEANMDEFDCPQLIVDAGLQDSDVFATDSGCEPVLFTCRMTQNLFPCTYF